jgi:hypothetical protein
VESCGGRGKSKTGEKTSGLAHDAYQCRAEPARCEIGVERDKCRAKWDAGRGAAETKFGAFNRSWYTDSVVAVSRSWTRLSYPA